MNRIHQDRGTAWIKKIRLNYTQPKDSSQLFRQTQVQSEETEGNTLS